MGIVKFLAYSTTIWLTTSWWLMVGVGIAHGWWWHQIPTMGFGTALLLGIFFGSMLTGGTTVTYAMAKGWLS